MVIGNGLLAKSFSSYANNENIIIFASGVSNSQETNPAAFKREHDLLLDVIQKNPEKTLVYFSTCSFYDPSAKDTAYVKHKSNMEKLIQQSIKNHYIFRLSHVVGKTNSPTIVNYLKHKIINGEKFELWMNSSRNLIASEDVYKLVNYICMNNLYKNEIVNIASPYNLSVKEIVLIMEKVLNKKASFNLVDKGATYDIDVSLIESITMLAHVKFNKEYINDVLKNTLL